MPLALLVVGVVILVTAFRGTTGDLTTLLKGDFTGPNNFTVWLLAIGFIGAIGAIPGMRPVATAFLVLLVVVILLSHKGFFDNLSSALSQTAAAPVISKVTAP